MIVNPRLFNYRLIIGSLVIAIVILSTISYSSYKTLRVNQRLIEQENKLVENELSEMISRYDAMDVQNSDIRSKLELTKTKINRILDSVKSLKPNVSLISRYKSQIQMLKMENEQVVELLKDLEAENNVLKSEKQQVAGKLEQVATVAKKLKNENLSLSHSNQALVKRINESKALSTAEFSVKGVKRVNSNRIINTRYANRAKKLHVCFTLVKNNFTEAGIKELYIQILDPKNNIVADKGAVHFGKESLIYTQKTSVEYNNEAMEVCSLIETSANEPLVKGMYFISVFHGSERIGYTSIALK